MASDTVVGFEGGRGGGDFQRSPAYGTVCDESVSKEIPLQEEESDEEEEQVVDTSKLSWPQYVLHYTCLGGKGALAVVDGAGEWLADFFGITGPRFWHVVQEYERQKEEEEKERRFFEREPAQQLECGQENT